MFLKSSGYRPRQVQDFIPAPMDIATCMWHTGLDPFTLEPVPSAKKLRDRVAQRALMQFFKPEHWFAIRQALLDAGRRVLRIDLGPAPEAVVARMTDAARL